MDKFDLSFGTVIAGLLIFLMAIVGSIIGAEAWRASEKAAAYKAYVECLHETKERAIDIQQMFCGKIREQL